MPFSKLQVDCFDAQMNDRSGHWINHQRADLFLPEYGVEWTLDVAGIIYEIGTRKGVKIEGTRKWQCRESN